MIFRRKTDSLNLFNNLKVKLSLFSTSITLLLALIAVTPANAKSLEEVKVGKIPQGYEQVMKGYPNALKNKVMKAFKSGYYSKEKLDKCLNILNGTKIILDQIEESIKNQDLSSALDLSITLKGNLEVLKKENAFLDEVGLIEAELYKLRKNWLDNYKQGKVVDGDFVFNGKVLIKGFDLVNGSFRKSSRDINYPKRSFYYLLRKNLNSIRDSRSDIMISDLYRESSKYPFKEILLNVKSHLLDANFVLGSDGLWYFNGERLPTRFDLIKRNQNKLEVYYNGNLIEEILIPNYNGLVDGNLVGNGTVIIEGFNLTEIESEEVYCLKSSQGLYFILSTENYYSHNSSSNNSAEWRIFNSKGELMNFGNSFFLLLRKRGNLIEAFIRRGGSLEINSDFVLRAESLPFNKVYIGPKRPDSWNLGRQEKLYSERLEEYNNAVNDPNNYRYEKDAHINPWIYYISEFVRNLNK